MSTPLIITVREDYMGNTVVISVFPKAIKQKYMKNHELITSSDLQQHLQNTLFLIKMLIYLCLF